MGFDTYSWAPCFRCMNIWFQTGNHWNHPLIINLYTKKGWWFQPIWKFWAQKWDQSSAPFFRGWRSSKNVLKSPSFNRPSPKSLHIIRSLVSGSKTGHFSFQKNNSIQPKNIKQPCENAYFLFIVRVETQTKDTHRHIGSVWFSWYGYNKFISFILRGSPNWISELKTGILSWPGRKTYQMWSSPTFI